MIEIILLFLQLLIFGVNQHAAQTTAVEPLASPILVTVSNVHPGPHCSEYRWSIRHDLEVDFVAPLENVPMTYIVQTVDDDITLVRFWGSGYSSQTDHTSFTWNYEVVEGSNNELIPWDFVIPLPDKTYQSRTDVYILDGDNIIWKIQAEVTCERGDIIAYNLTSEAAAGTTADLPTPGSNLVLALEDTPIYRSENVADLEEPSLIIESCQTFSVSDIHVTRPQSGITAGFVEGTESIVFLPPYSKFVDVGEDYGQPGGEPIADACRGA
jgi:hypothetical protein